MPTWLLPALLAWASAWGFFCLGQRLGLSGPGAGAAAVALGVAMSLMGNSWWRRLLIALIARIPGALGPGAVAGLALAAAPGTAAAELSIADLA